MDGSAPEHRNATAPIAVMTAGGIGIPVVLLLLAAAGLLPIGMAVIGLLVGLGWALATLPALIRRLR